MGAIVRKRPTPSEAAAFKMKVCSERLKGGEREGGEWQYRIMTIMQKLKDLFHVDITLSCGTKLLATHHHTQNNNYTELIII